MLCACSQNTSRGVASPIAGTHKLERVLHQTLDVEALRRHDLVDGFISQSLQDRRLTRVVKPQHEYSGLILAPLEFLE